MMAIQRFSNSKSPDRDIVLIAHGSLKSRLKKLPGFFASSCVFFTLGTSAVFSTTADDTTQKAIASFKAGNFAEACPLFERLVERDPGNLRAQYYLALVCQKLGQNDRATILFEKIITASPASAEARYSQAALKNSPVNKITNPAGSHGTSASSSPMSEAAAAAILSPPASREIQEAQAQAGQILESAKRQSEALNARADKIAKEMAAVPRSRGYGSAYSQNDIDAETLDIRKQSADVTARAKRESDEIVNRAKLREESSASSSSLSNRSAGTGLSAYGSSSIISSVGGTTTYATTSRTKPTNARAKSSNVAAPKSEARGNASASVASPASTGAVPTSLASIPHIDEIDYWHKARTVVPENDLASALMLKPKYRADILAGKTTLQSIFDDNYTQPQRESDSRWVEKFKSQKLNFNPIKDIAAANYNIDQFVGYRIGKAGRVMDGDGFCYKVFFDFQDANLDLTPELYLKFSNALSDAGFVGDSKISTKPGFCRFFYNDIIVHTTSPENGKIAERVGLAVFGSKLSHTGRGLDVMLTRANGVFSDNTDWHHYLAKTSDLSNLSAAAINYVNFAD